MAYAYVLVVWRKLGEAELVGVSSFRKILLGPKVLTSPEGGGRDLLTPLKKKRRSFIRIIKKKWLKEWRAKAKV